MQLQPIVIIFHNNSSQGYVWALRCTDLLSTVSEYLFAGKQAPAGNRSPCRLVYSSFAPPRPARSAASILALSLLVSP